MRIVLIDGVKYEERTPANEDELERAVKEHAEDIFGEDSIYFDIKHKLKSKAGIGSIPDGFVIIPGDQPQWHIVEVELSSHAYEHIAGQVSRFINGIDDPSTQRKIVDALYENMGNDEFVKLRLKKAIGTTDTHKFLSDLISGPAVLTIIIEKHTRRVDEALKMLNYPHENKKVVEFQTFTREGIGLDVHVHLFEPVYQPSKAALGPDGDNGDGKGKIKARKVTFRELINAGLLEDRQVLCFHHTRLFSEEQAEIVAPSNELKYKGDGKLYSASELAKKLLIKHGFKHDEHGVAGPKYWKTQDGKLLDDLNEQIRNQRGDRK